MEIRASDIERELRSDEEVSIRVVHNGPLAVLVFEDRVFLYSRYTSQAFELKPDLECGLMIYAI